MRRRLRRAGPAGVSFFAFQDIITSVTGILLIITVFLSLSINDDAATPLSDGDRQTPELKAKLDDLLQTIASRRQVAEAASDSSTAAPQSLAAEVALLEEEAAALAALVAARPPEREPKPQSVLDAAVARDAAAAQLEARLLKEKIVRLKAEVAKMSAARAAAETEVKRRDAALLAAMEKQHRLILIRDRARTSKEPVVSVLNAGGLTLQRFDSAAKESVTSVEEFRRLLRGFAAGDHYFVFYNKPSGAAEIESYLSAARLAGFDVGYDAVPEDFLLELETSKPSPP